MKRLFATVISLSVLVSLCACTADIKENSSRTAFMLNTVVTLEASCDEQTLNGAFTLCEDFENVFSKTKNTSELYKLNNAVGDFSVSNDLKTVLQKAVYYGNLSSGRFDVTLCDVINLWDFNEEIIPEKKEISEALKNVDYQSIKIDKNTVNLNGKNVDLGGIAKGYIADKIKEYFKNKNVDNGIINLGGNVVVFGETQEKIGIKNPFGVGEIAATVTVKNKCVVTSGTYERAFSKDGTLYHHILDSKTGYPVVSDLVSATIIGDSAVSADALSTICVLFGVKDALSLINSIENTECILIDSEGNSHYSNGLYREIDDFYFK